MPRAEQRLTARGWLKGVAPGRGQSALPQRPQHIATILLGGRQAHQNVPSTRSLARESITARNSITSSAIFRSGTGHGRPMIADSPAAS